MIEKKHFFKVDKVDKDIEMLQGFQSASAKIHPRPTEIDLEANGWVKLLSPTTIP